MLILEPKYIILDEPDSGLDISALKMIASIIQKIKTTQNALLVITHSPKIVEYLNPEVVHILKDKKIIKTGNKQLIYEIEKKGFI